MLSTNCYHCGDDCIKEIVHFNNKIFCCNGCKTVYEILSDNELINYYDLEQYPGKNPEEIEGKYDYLTNEHIVEKLYDFQDDTMSVITLHIPQIHCSSCIWVLEHLNKLNPAIISSTVNFPKKEVRLTFENNKIGLKQLVELLSSIGYEPTISLEKNSIEKGGIDRSLIYKVAVAGFAFGNIMLLSFPEYFQSNGYWLEKYKPLFRAIIFITSLPVVFYAASDYFISAFKGLKHQILNIDVPIALGISVLFLRSSYELFYTMNQGYFDSLAGFVFFLLLGKIFQQQTYSFLSFERDYKSYFPIAVTKIENDKTENSISIYDVNEGDKLLIRNNELVPVDGLLLSNNAEIDYSFVTGESLPVSKYTGDKIFAGGKQVSGTMEMEVLHTISQSYLTQLWSNDIFKTKSTSQIKNLTNSISKQFTIALLCIAFVVGVFWYFIDVAMVANVVTAVLIVACPCALALSAPFALGNMLRILGNRKIYLKNADVIENLAHIDTVVFDKTGTITTTNTKISYTGYALSENNKEAIKSLVRTSNHPLSRMLNEYFETNNLKNIEKFQEVTGKGIEGVIENKKYKIGSAGYANFEESTTLMTSVYLNIEDKPFGKFIFKNSYRERVDFLFTVLEKRFDLLILSGDNEGEKDTLQKILPKETVFVFNQSPMDKLDFIKELQESGKNVLMIGDGLNDAGALAQSNVGLVVSEDINVFSPASDGIIDASKFSYLANMLKLSRSTLSIIKMSFVISLLYNLIGMYYAVTGQLSPIIAAILMPLSSITVVIFVTMQTNFIASRKKYKT